MQRGETEVGLPAAAATRRRVGARIDPLGWPGAARRALTQRRLVLASGLAAALPVIVATAQIVADRWVPLGDDALIAVRSLDVLSTHSPLVGEVSSGTSTILGQSAHHLGPLLYWLLAVPARFMDPSALEVTIGLINVASVMAIVSLAHSRGGRQLMFAVAIAIPLMLASVPPDAYADIWNPSAPVLPFTLLVFLTWSLACGEYRLLPVTVLVASYVVQCHLTYLVPTLGVLTIGLGGLTVSRRSLRQPRDPSRARQARDPRRPPRRWVVAAVVVGLVCWSGPLLDQVVHRPGNLVLLLRAAGTGVPKMGFDAGWHALVRAVGIVPWWLRQPQVPIVRVADLSAAPSALAIGSTVLILGGLAAAMLAARRRHRRDVFAAGALGLVLCGALVVVTTSTPREFADTLGYSLWWAAPVGMWVLLALGWSLCTLLRPAVRRAPPPWPALGAFAGVATVAALGSIVAASADRMREPYREMRIIAARLRADLPGDRTTRVDASSTTAAFMALGFQAGIVYSLRDEGRTVVASGIAGALGSRYEPGHHGAEQVVRVDVDNPPPDRARVIVRLTVPDYPTPGDPFAPKVTPKRSVVVSLLPASR